MFSDHAAAQGGTLANPPFEKRTAGFSFFSIFRA
jgi:hypothetical protein